MQQIYKDLIQGTQEWFEARRGILTASEMKHIITPTLKIADNDKSRSHLLELSAQNISGYVEPSFCGDHMLRGKQEEIDALAKYEELYGPIQRVGFVKDDRWGFTLGCSPDGLVGEEGMVQTKSRLQKFQVDTIVNNEMPEDFKIQVQTELLVTNRKWSDFISYCGGLHMCVIRIFPDERIQQAILSASGGFYKAMKEKIDAYNAAINDPNRRLVPTERKEYQEQDIIAS